MGSLNAIDLNKLETSIYMTVNKFMKSHPQMNVGELIGCLEMIKLNYHLSANGKRIKKDLGERFLMKMKKNGIKKVEIPKKD